MENFSGLSDTLFDQDHSRLECLDAFDPFWQENDQVGSTRPSPAESYCGGEQRKAVEEEDSRSQPIVAQQLHDYGSDAEGPWGGIRYAIEWKAVVRSTRIGIDTEQEVSLSPEAFWETTLRKKVEDLLARKFSPQDRPEPDDTVVVVSVSKRGEPDLSRVFVGFDIRWSVIEAKLESWACHFHEGKRLTVKINFRFRPSNTFSRAQGDARGRQSATRRMRHDQALQQNAEEHAAGEAAPWRTVYSLLRCPGRPCQNNQGYCWRDPHGGKHYKLLTSHMKQLVAHMQKGNKFEGRNDVPDSVRQELYAEANQRIERYRNTRHSLSTYPQAPDPTPHPTPDAMQYSPVQTPSSVIAAAPNILERLDIPGPHEDAIHDYVRWQQHQARSDEWIAQFAKAGDILLKGGYKLGLFYERQLTHLLTAEGVIPGIALSFHSDILVWLPEYRRKYEEGNMASRATPSLD